MTVVVSTHLDDAVLSCYHVLGSDTTVVTVLAGVPPPGKPGTWDSITGVSDSPARMRERLDEDREALAISGSRVVHLDLLDSQYADVPLPAEIARSLAPLLEPARDVLAPAGIRNLDHETIRDAVLHARPDAVLYADLPYALHPRLRRLRVAARGRRPGDGAGGGAPRRSRAPREAGRGPLLPNSGRPARRLLR